MVGVAIIRHTRNGLHIIRSFSLRMLTNHVFDLTGDTFHHRCELAVVVLFELVEFLDSQAETYIKVGGQAVLGRQ